MKKRFHIQRDFYGYVDAITYGRWTVLHLQPGTERNERNARWLVGVLNGKRVEPPKEKP